MYVTTLNKNNMRPRINKRAVCSSKNYRESKLLHMEMLIDNHCSISQMSKADVTVNAAELASLNGYKPQYVTVRVMGKEKKVSLEVYEEHYKHLGFKCW